MRIDQLKLLSDINDLDNFGDRKLMVNTINTYSYTVAKRDQAFEEALSSSDVLLPDGIGIVWASKLFKKAQPLKNRITGWDLFTHEMERLAKSGGGKCFFMGSSDRILEIIKQKAAEQYPNIEIVTYSPPYRDEFSDEENDAMVKAINDADPDLLWIGMSAPKQEKWLARNWDKLNIHCHAGSIGAVFSFFAGTEKRAPKTWCSLGLEWLYRFIQDPGRLWPRYVTGNLKFLQLLYAEAVSKK